MGKNVNLTSLIRQYDPNKKDFPSLPPGKYEAVVHEAEFTTASTGNPMFVIKYKVTEEGQFKNRLLWHRVTLTEGNTQVAVRQLLAAGAPSPEDIGEALEDSDASLSLIKAMTGTPVFVTVKLGKWEGKDTNEVTNVSERHGTKEQAEEKEALKPKKKDKDKKVDVPF